MRAKIEEVGIHFSRRRSNRDKYRFMNRLVSQLKESRIPMQMLQEKKSRGGTSNHLVAGKPEKSRWIVMASYDTGSKMLNPCYEFTPLNSKHNFREEMKNVAGYSVLTLFVAAFAVFWTRNFPEYSMLWKVLTVLGDVLVLGLVWRWMKKPDNKMNMNRNSGAVAVLYDCAEKSRTGCFVFVDRGVMSNEGFYELAPKFGRQSVLILESIASGEELFLAFRKGQEKKADEIVRALECKVHLLALDEESYKNTPLEGFENGFMLTGGSLKKGTVCVKNVRNGKDFDMDLEQLQKIEDGILRLTANDSNRNQSKSRAAHH